MPRTRITLACITLCLILALFAAAHAQQKKQYSKPPEMQIDTTKTYTATIDTTNGKITLALFAAEAPQTVNNFVFLAKEGFYDGVIFHRVIPGFMIQGGDPTGTGRGGPGYKFDNENRGTRRAFTPGTIAMANAGLNTNGSQFFIMHKNYALRPDTYTIFGEVKEGLDVVNTIVTAPRNDEDRPNEPTTIKSITIVAEPPATQPK